MSAAFFVHFFKPITNYALFYDGEYVTNEQMNDKKFLKLTGM